MEPGVKIVLHLQPLPAGPDDPPAARRLAIVLKKLLRGYGFRCVHAALLEGQLAAPPEEDLAAVLEDVPTPAPAARLTGQDGREGAFPEERPS